MIQLVYLAWLGVLALTVIAQAGRVSVVATSTSSLSVLAVYAAMWMEGNHELWTVVLAFAVLGLLAPACLSDQRREHGTLAVLATVTAAFALVRGLYL